jgi:hypothetical protein
MTGKMLYNWELIKISHFSLHIWLHEWCISLNEMASMDLYLPKVWHPNLLTIRICGSHMQDRNSTPHLWDLFWCFNLLIFAISFQSTLRHSIHYSNSKSSFHFLCILLSLIDWGRSGVIWSRNLDWKLAETEAIIEANQWNISHFRIGNATKIKELLKILASRQMAYLNKL